MTRQDTVRGRRTWAGLAAASLVLTVAGCGAGADSAGSAGQAPSAASASASSAAGGPTEPTPSVTASATASGDSSRTPQADDEIFTTEAGTVSLSIPAGWTVDCEVCGSSSGGPPAGVTERYTITDKDDDIVVGLTTVSGARGGDGAYPTLVRTVAAERLDDVTSYQGDAAVYLLTQHLAEPEDFDMSAPWGEATEGLSVQVADVPHAVDPESPESVRAAWIHLMTDDYPAKDFTGLYLSTSIALPMVEALTGEQGDEAMQAFLSTTEYRELERMMSSVEVHEDAIPYFENTSPRATPSS